MSDKHGGPAFPRTGVGNAGHSYDVPPQDGMSLRDYFAGQALAGIIACPGAEPDDASREGCASLAYGFADAMLAEREKCEPS